VLKYKENIPPFPLLIEEKYCNPLEVLIQLMESEGDSILNDDECKDLDDSSHGTVNNADNECSKKIEMDEVISVLLTSILCIIIILLF
jgi:hypothetical protein